MKKLLLLLPVALSAGAQPTLIDGRKALVLEGPAASLAIDIRGGSIVDFHLAGQTLNPLVWAREGDKNEARGMAHFLCLDRWGAPSEAEKSNGMPFHGEASRVEWTVSSPPVRRDGAIEAGMSASLPMAGLDLRRRIRLSDRQAVFTVTEAVTNRNKLGRVYNMVQHPTIGPPFLDESTLVDANAGKGFMQSSPMPNPEQPSIHWPLALRDGEPVDLRRLTNDPNPNVVSFVIDEEYGWTTAANPAKELLIGYLWKTSDYPWFNAWRHTAGGKPLARGLEFGTTGLHQPYPVLVQKGRIFDRPLFAFLDAGETQERKYAAFLLRIPQDFRGAGRIVYRDGKITLQEKGTGRILTIPSGELFRD